jgi:hypothetical protein
MKNKNINLDSFETLTVSESQHILLGGFSSTYMGGGEISTEGINFAKGCSCTNSGCNMVKGCACDITKPVEKPTA